MSIVNFFRRSRVEKYKILCTKLHKLYTIPFRIKKVVFGGIYLAYQPDSFIRNAEHQEFHVLFKKFTEHNERNSGDIPRLLSFILNCKKVLDDGVAGNIAELGVWKGNTSAILAYYANQYHRRIYLLDTYEGFDVRDLHGIDADKTLIFNNTSLSEVQSVVGTDFTHCEYIKGRFPESITSDMESDRYSIVSLDCDLYEPMKAGLDFFYPRLSKGGIFFLHDYSSTRWAGAKKAIDEFCAETKEYIILMPDKSGSAFLRKSK